MDPVTRVNFVGRPARRRVGRPKKVPPPKPAYKIVHDVPIELQAYSKKPGSGYMKLSRFIDEVIASSKEDEYVTSSWMKVGI